MWNIRYIFKEYSQQLQEIYPSHEAESLVYWLLNHFLRLKRKDILQEKTIDKVPPALEHAMRQLLEGMPIQYITHSAPFYGRDYKVNPSVLIPRNETEELVHLIIKENRGQGLKIMDVGTGSGCISITLSLEMDHALVSAIDISEAALDLSHINSTTLGASVDFLKIDVLNEDLPQMEMDILVSNPPYVRESEKVSMHQNVLNHEPHVALFVPDEDPLVFYRVISQKGKSVLKSGGRLYFEINEALGQQVVDLLSALDYKEIRLIKDLNERDRIIAAVKP